MIRLSLLSALVFALALSACDEPSSAGLDLIGEEGGVPMPLTVSASAIEQDTLSEVTGGFAALSLPTVSRTLVGRADDPLFGVVSADAFIDFVRPASLPEGFTDGTVTRVVLELPVEYVYGDPEGVSRYELFEIPDDWSPTEASPDSVFVDFGTAEAISSVDVSRSDTTVTIELPEAWVGARGEALTASGFESEFHGLALRAAGDGEGYAGPGIVRGFDAPRIRLALSVADTTVRFAANEVATRIAWGDVPSTPQNRIVARDGANEVIEMAFPLDREGVAGQPLNNAEFRVALDTLLYDTPAGSAEFERPQPETLEFLGVLEGETNALLRLGVMVFDADLGVYRLSSATLTSFMQDEILGANVFSGYQLRVPNDPASLDVLPVFSPELPDQAPRFEFVVSGGN
ncbi:MAG: hypothetical protein AAGF99_11990 [Bacteroidota bacterium]